MNDFHGADIDAARRHLAAIERVAAGDAAAGPIAALDTTARFHWLVAPSSTIVQPSRVHTGLCDDPDACLDELFERLVHLVTYLSMPLLGAFWMVFWLPYEAQRLALWIPTVHIFELIRDGHFGGAVPTTYDIGYVLAWIAGKPADFHAPTRRRKTA